jgi:hypothetical protein
MGNRKNYMRNFISYILITVREVMLHCKMQIGEKNQLLANMEVSITVIKTEAV